MGTTQHDLVAWTFQAEHLEKVKEYLSKFRSKNIICGPVMVNEYVTLIILPSGSNVGWGDSNNWGIIRSAWKDWFKKNVPTAEMIHVTYGELGTRLIE